MVDATDKRILNVLAKNADWSRKNVATEVELSEPSLSKKIGILRAQKIIKNFSVNIDFEKVGYGVNAVTLIKMKAQHKDKVDPLIRKFAGLNSAIEVYSVLGQWDIYIRWICRNNSDVMETLRSVTDDSVEHTETYTLATEHKRQNGPAILDDKT